MYNKGQVFNIQRFSSSDGPEIRTVVFLKGCPLNCAWCHNPKSKNMKTEIFYMQKLCIDCKACVNVCPKKCHQFEKNTHIFKRADCDGCGICSKSCLPNALKSCEKKCRRSYRRSFS